MAERLHATKDGKRKDCLPKAEEMRSLVHQGAFAGHTGKGGGAASGHKSPTD